MFWCPACEAYHAYYVNVKNIPSWVFNGDLNNPTFTPSLLLYNPKEDGKRETKCHLFLTNGIIKYCGDCPHDYAGKSIPLESEPK